MDSASFSLKESRRNSQSADRPEGFSLLEMMLVVTLILIVVSIATPSYKTCPSVDGRAREAVLRDDLYTLRFLIDPSADGPCSLAAERAGAERLSGQAK